jgi:hypothetical protein
MNAIIRASQENLERPEDWLNRFSSAVGHGNSFRLDRH